MPIVGTTPVTAATQSWEGIDVSIQNNVTNDALCAAIQEALMLADACENTLVAALLSQAQEAAHCHGG